MTKDKMTYEIIAFFNPKRYGSKQQGSWISYGASYFKGENTESAVFVQRKIAEDKYKAQLIEAVRGMIKNNGGKRQEGSDFARNVNVYNSGLREVIKLMEGGDE